jgi:hypothetical protein
MHKIPMWVIIVAVFLVFRAVVSGMNANGYPNGQQPLNLLG